MAKAAKLTLHKTGATGLRGTLSAAAAHVFLDRSRFVELQAKGIFPATSEEGFDLDEIRERALAHSRAQASGRGGSAGEKLSEERARQARAGADAQEMKNAVRRGELLEVARVVGEYADDLEGLRGALLNIPGRIGQEAATMTPGEIANRVAELLDDALLAMRSADEVAAKVQAEQMGDAEGTA